MATDILPLKIYNASAGSGKTYTLVKEFLLLSLPNPAKFRKILALTFTRKAAGGMRERVILELNRLSSGASNSMERTLTEAGLRKEAIDNAPELLKLILCNYSDFGFSTIDSFFSRIVRNFAQEFGLNYEFRTEEDMDRVNELTVQRFSRKASDPENRELMTFLSSHIAYKIQNGDNWDIKELLKAATKLLGDDHLIDVLGQRSGLLFPDTGQEAESEEKEFFRKLTEYSQALRKEIKIFHNQCDVLSEKVERYIESANIQNDFKGSSTKIFFNIHSKKFDISVFDNIATARTCYGEGDWYNSTGPKSLLRDAVHNQFLTESAGELFNEIVPQLGDYIFRKVILDSLPKMAVVIALAREMQAIKSEENIMLMDDQKRIINEHLKVGGEGMTSFIYSKIGSAYDHIFIDEFQDTSQMQWENLKPLVSESISNGNTSLVVGDVKQSLYRWRGGRLSLLANEVGKEFSGFSQLLNLQNNFRSDPKIVAFNNIFFKALSAHILSGELEDWRKELYQSVEQVSNVATSGKGEVNVWNYSVDYIPEIIEQEYSNKCPIDLYNADRVLCAIRDLKAQAESRGELYQEAEITILCRTASNIRSIGDYLLKYGIDFVTDSGAFLEKSLAVRIMLSSMRYVAQESDLLARKEVEALHRLYISEQTELSEIFDNREVNFLPEFLKDASLASLRRLHVYQLAEQLSHYYTFNSDDQAYVDQLLEVVYEYIQEPRPDLRGFFRWYKNDRKVSIPQNAPGVRIMTIHKSKGLEFRHVIVPIFDSTDIKENEVWIDTEYTDFPETIITFSAGLETHANLKEIRNERFEAKVESMNNLYVAFTRAVESLHIINGEITKEKDPINKGQNMSNKLQIGMKQGFQVEYGSTGHVYTTGNVDQGAEMQV